MNKNLCIGRQFHTLKKEQIREKTTPIFIDVWPLNFLLPETCAQLDSTCLFMLQLSCILNMVSVWKKATVRVFLCSDNLDITENQRRKSRLDDLLNKLRIQAFTTLVPIENVRNLLNRPVIPEGELHHYQHLFTNLDILNTSEIYLKAANGLIKTYSDNATLCFLYLPPPPALQQQQQQQQQEATNDEFINLNVSTNNNNNNNNNNINNPFIDTALFPSTSLDQNKENTRKYIKILDTLSHSLPPCIFVNGVNVVTSTTL
jgi:potassium/chloride transporter 9